MTHLVNNLQPLIYHKTGRPGDIITFSEPEMLNFDKLPEGNDYCLVIERGDFPAIRKKIKNAKTPPRLKNIFFLASGGRCMTNQINFLPSKPSLDEIKLILFRIMTTDYGADISSIERLICCLTEEEKELLALVVAGNSVAEISVRLGLAPQAVYAGRTRLLSKLGMDSLSELVTSAAVLDLQH